MKILAISLAALAAATSIAGSASADTMNKCTDANGKVTFTDQPCAAQSKASTLNVPAPLSEAERAQIANEESQKLYLANEEFKKRAAERDRNDADEERTAALNRHNKKTLEASKTADQLEQDRETARRGAVARRQRERDVRDRNGNYGSYCRTCRF